MHGQHGLKSGWSQMGWSTVWVSSTAIRVCQSSGIIMSETLEASHVVECIEKAKKIRRITHPLIIHADRGCQYVSDAFRKATEGMVNSYSKKHIHGIMRVLNRSMHYRKGNGSTVLKFLITGMHISWYSNI